MPLRAYNSVIHTEELVNDPVVSVVKNIGLRPGIKVTGGVFLRGDGRDFLTYLADQVPQFRSIGNLLPGEVIEKLLRVLVFGRVPALAALGILGLD
jgi:hypothetical protein